MKLLRALFLAPLFVPGVAAAAALTFEELAWDIVNILDLATITLIVFGIVAYFWGISINIGHFGHDDKEGKKKSYFLWGLIILFVMVSVWGIIHLLQDSLFGNEVLNPTTGQQRQVFCDRFGDCTLQ